MFSQATLPAATPAPTCRAVASKWPQFSLNRTAYPSTRVLPLRPTSLRTAQAMPPPLQPLPIRTSPTARPFKKNLCQATAPLFSHVSPPAKAGPLLEQPLQFFPSEANQTIVMTPRIPQSRKSNQCFLFCSLVKERESAEQCPAVQVGYLE